MSSLLERASRTGAKKEASETGAKPPWGRLILIAGAQGVVLLLALTWFTDHIKDEVGKAVEQQVLIDVEQAARQLADGIEQIKPPPVAANLASWEPVQKLLERAKLGNGGYFCVVDSTTGNLLCHPQMRGNQGMRSLKPGQSVLQGPQGERRIIDAFTPSGDATIPIVGPAPTVRGRVQLPDGDFIVAARKMPRLSAIVLALQRDGSIQMTAAEVSRVVWLWGLAAAALLLALTIYLIVSSTGQVETAPMDAESTRVIHFRATELAKANQELRMQLQESKRTEEAMQTEAEGGRRLIQSLQGCAFFALDVEGRVSGWNAAAEALTGYSAGEITGEPFAWLYADEDQKKNKPERHLRECDASGRCEVVGWRVRRDGSRFWAREMITPMRDELENALGFAVVLRDITAHKNDQAAKRMREAVLESLGDGLIISGARTADHPVLYCNPAWERITGCSPSEVLGKPLSQFFGPNDIDPALVEVRQAISEDRSIALEAPARRKDGTLFWSQISVSVVHSARGRPQYLAILLRDLTEQKQQEAQVFLREKPEHPAQCSDTMMLANLQTR